MRIAIDISQIAYSGTGVATYTSQLVQYLLRIDDNNDYLLFGISLRNQQKLQEYYTQVKNSNSRVVCKFILIPQTLANLLWNRYHILKIDNFLGKVDLYHSSDWIQPPTRSKKVTTIHDLVVYKYPDSSHSYIIETQKRRLHWVKKECDLVFADSFSTKKDLIEILCFNPNKIEIVYPGIGYEFKRQDREEIDRVRNKYHLYNDFILMVGTVEPRKNLRTVLAAFERFTHHSLIHTKKSPVEFVIAGKLGWGVDLPSTEKIHLLGYVDQKDLPGLYSGASLLVYPSLYEGFGLPVLEAMTCGCPVIASDRGSIKEIVDDAALLIDPDMVDDLAVNMTKLFVDKDLRTSLIQRGEENAKRFTWKKAALEILRLYRKVVFS